MMPDSNLISNFYEASLIILLSIRNRTWPALSMRLPGPGRLKPELLAKSYNEGWKESLVIGLS